MRYLILGIGIIFIGIFAITRNHMQAVGALIVIAGAALFCEKRKKLCQRK